MFFKIIFYEKFFMNHVFKNVFYENYVKMSKNDDFGQKCEKPQKTPKKGGSDPPPKTEDQHKQNCFKGRTEIVFRTPGWRVNQPLIRGGGPPLPGQGFLATK